MKISELISEFNQCYKEINKLYHDYAKSNGLSDSVLWMLYFLYENQEGYTQRQLSSEWGYAPQTVNSALKGMERKGLIELILLPGSRKNKRVILTEAGRNMAREIIAPLMKAEQNALCALSDQERIELLSLEEKHIRLLKNEIIKLSSED